MPKYLSAFTPCGLLQLSSKPAKAELYYRALIDAYGPAFDATVGTHHEASCYAKARALARADYAQVRAGNQRHPLKALDLLPQQEQSYHVVPGPFDTIPTRQAAVAAAKVLSRGARLESVVDGLRKILGDNFLAFRPMATSEATVYPTWPSSQASLKANPTLSNAPAKLVQITDPVGVTGSPTTVQYTNVDATQATVYLAAGDVVMVQPENTAQSEKVTVTSASNVTPWVAYSPYAFGALVLPPTATGFYYTCSVAGTSGTTAPTFPTDVGSTVTDGTATWTCTALTPAPRSFTATFTLAHDVGASVTTGSWPYQWSTQHFVMVIVQAAASVDAETRRKVNAFMGKVMRAPTQWGIVQPSTTTGTGGTVGPFFLDASALGAVPIGTFAFTNSP